MKKLIILILFLSVATTYGGYLLYKQNHTAELNKELLGKDLSCSIFSKSRYNQDQCLKIALRNFLDGYISNSLAIIDYNCEYNKHLFSCFAFQRLNQFLVAQKNSINTRPLSIFINNCRTGFIEENEDASFCFELDDLASKLNDRSVHRIKEIYNCKVENCKMDFQREDLFLPAFAQEDLYSRYCKKRTPACDKLGMILDIRRLIDNPKSEDKGFELFNLFCSKEEKICKHLILEMHDKINFVQALRITDFNGLNLTNSNDLDEAKSLSTSEVQEFKSNYLKYQILNLRGEFNQVEQLCQKHPDKRGCVFRFKTVGELSQNKQVLKRYCLQGDDYSCIMQTLLEKEHFSLPPTTTLFSLLNNVPLLVVNDIVYDQNRIDDYTFIYWPILLLFLVIISFNFLDIILDLREKVRNLSSLFLSIKSENIKKRINKIQNKNGD